MQTNENHQDDARRLRELLAKYAEIEVLVQVGEFKSGNDPVADQAIAAMPHITSFLQQSSNEVSPLLKTIEDMSELLQ